MNRPEVTNQQSQGYRARQAIVIRTTPENYQVCLGCNSIVRAGLVTCPACHSYRFDADPETVCSTALELGKRRPTFLSH